MRTTLLALSLSLATLHGLAQFPTIASAPDGVASLLSLSGGPKLMDVFWEDSIHLYELDMTPYRTLPVPAPPDGYYYGSVNYITETLFDTDPSTIEYLMLAYGGVNQAALFIYREDGSTVFSANPGVTMSRENGPAIFEGPNGAVMLLNTGFTIDTHVLQLPGHVPCVTACLPEAIDPVGISPVTGSTPRTTAYPNPVDASLSVTYELPDGGPRATLLVHDVVGKLVASRALDASGRSTLDTSTLSPGQYRYSIVSGTRDLGGAKFIVAH